MSTTRTSSSRGPGSAQITGFYDEDSGSIQYLAADLSTKKAALIDIVLSFDPASACINTDSAEAILRHVERENLEVEWILDTHPHADHLMASSFLKERLGRPNAIGEKVVEIAGLWRDLYHLPDAFDPERDFDHLFADGDSFQLGSLPVKVMFSPGHTLGSISYLIGTDAAFVHDTFMQPDVGTARGDFPGGSAEILYDTLQTILTLPDETRLFVGHDYGTDDRPDPEWESTVAVQRADNKHIGGGVSKQSFVEKRQERDATLALPDRMLHVLQMNLRAGRVPDTEADGHAYLKIPLNRF